MLSRKTQIKLIRKHQRPPAMPQSTQSSTTTSPENSFSSRSLSKRQDRAELFRSLGQRGRGGQPGTPRWIRSADDLSRDELRECFRILQASTEAASDGGVPDPHRMEAFLEEVFEHKETCRDRWIHGVHGVAGPSPDGGVSYPAVSCHIARPRGTSEHSEGDSSVKMHISYTSEPYELTFSLVDDTTGEGVSANDFSKHEWDPPEIAQANLRAALQAQEEIIRRDARRVNYERAKDYAAYFIHLRSTGVSMAGSVQPYDYFRDASIRSIFPVLSSPSIPEDAPFVLGNME